MKQITVIDQDTNNDFTFYDNANGTILNANEGFEYSSVRETIEDIAGKQSAIYMTSKFGRRRFSWAGDLVGANIFSNRRAMLVPMRQTGRIKLIKFTTYDDLELQCEAEIVKVLNPYTHGIHTFLIEAIAPDWRFYDQQEKESNSNGEEQTFTNDGNEQTSPIFRIHGSADAVEITLLNTSEAFIIDYELDATDYIDVDIKNRTVLLNGTTFILSSFSGSFFDFVPGENTISFVPTNPDGDTSLRTIFRDAYSGI